MVQNHVTNGEDPAQWVWDENDDRWEESDGTPIDHGTDQDQNVIVDVALDLAGRRTGLVDPRGHATSYTYDRLDRRTGLTDPLAHTWATAYSDLPGGAGTRVELTNPLSQVTRRDSDRLGLLTQLSYLNEAPKLTPDVAFGYDLAGNRTRMSEDDGTNPVRETLYAFDAARRLTGVDFDTDGDSQVEQSVAYEYDAGGLRTKLTLPGDLSLTYTYDTRGQLVGLEDWDGQRTRYTYDLAGRLVATDRENSFRTRYVYDAGGRLRQLRHARGGRTMGHFAYEVDALGNRTQALEALPQPGMGQTVLGSDHGALDYHRGTWTASGDLMTSSNPDAALRVAFFGDSATLTLGVGPDHGLCDVYVDGGLWRSFDNYAASAGEDAIALPLAGEGPHVLEVRNRSDRNRASTGYKLSFKSLVTESLYDLHTIQYGYDGLSRLQSADYFPGGNVNGVPFRQYGYAFDLSGNRTSETVTVDGVPTQTAYTYNAANQISSGGVTYDAAGRMTNDGTNAYTWDRADRLLSMGVVQDSAYNGLGQRVSQTVSSVVTEYLLDVQPGLWKVIAETAQGDTTRYVHGPRGIQAIQAADWGYSVQDALGSVRGEVGADLAVNGMRHLAPYGDPFGKVGTFESPYGFTGEQTDGNRQVYLRARYYDPSMGVFSALDPMEGDLRQIMGLNRYAYSAGNPANYVDPTGMIYESPYGYDPCGSPPAQTWRDCSCYAPGGGLEDPLKYRLCRLGSYLFSCPDYDLNYPTPTTTEPPNQDPGSESDECIVTTDNWGDPAVLVDNNCYTYAVDLQLHGGYGGLHPGNLSRRLGDYAIESGGVSYTCAFWEEALRLDQIAPADSPTDCANRCSGGYPIYMVVAEGYDYHFYRMDAQGVWTHKLGHGRGTYVRACDANNQPISDPASANHDYSLLNDQFNIYYNYNRSCGYYCVCPQEIEEWKSSYS